jgi:hypothetical protein
MQVDRVNGSTQLETTSSTKWLTFTRSVRRGGKKPSTAPTPATTSLVPPQELQTSQRPTTSPGTSNRIPGNTELSVLSIHHIFMENTLDLAHRSNPMARLKNGLNSVHPNPAGSSSSHPNGFTQLSSNSNAGLIREAVTDARIIVNVSATGVLQSGTLKGLVERLITSFGQCRCLKFQS